MARKPKPRRLRVVRHRLPNGKRCPSTHPKAIPYETRTETYYATVHGKDVSLHTKDLSEAWAELRRLQQGGQPTNDLARPLADLIPEFGQSLRDGGSSPMWVKSVEQRLVKLVGMAGWRLAKDMEADGLLRALAALQRGHGISNQTRNHYLTHAHAFSHWLRRRTGHDPLDGVGRPLSAEADPRHPRRSPTEEEIGSFFAYLASPAARTRWRMAPRQRALGYLVCMSTGFRAGELRQLTRESFDLERGTATCQGAYSKRRRLDTQPLPGWLVAELREWFAGGGGCWKDFPSHHPGQVLQADLAAAGIPYETSEGFWDMHSLRHYYITFLANQPGMSIKTLTELARHSTAQLSVQVYAKARRHDLHAAVDQLPPPATPPKPRAQDG